ncbi:MAG: Agmatine deiminase [Verrucomicrobiae bacterium]|nr:Agmatine deiminase [Verrucomicrobiae bacterium]
MTPAKLGYRMPAEWAPHAATWLSWPRPDGISFPDRYDEILPTLGKLVRALAPHERVNINCRNEEVEEIARKTVGKTPNVRYHRNPSYEPWCRDHGPIFVKRGKNLAIVDWGYNAWGGKYPPFDDDDAVPVRIAEQLGLPLFQPGIIMEGGSLDVNGRGLLLTTEACLLNKNRNPKLSKKQIEQYLKAYLGVTSVIWLGDGIVGDDTDGHVDDLTRFVNVKTVVTVVEDDPDDANYAPLQDNLERLRETGLRIVELPMPGCVEYDGQRLPASYANFYIANNVVLLPTYRHKQNDRRAAEILQKHFPTRRVVSIDSTDLIWGLGSFHCLTQQQPA